MGWKFLGRHWATLAGVFVVGAGVVVYWSSQPSRRLRELGAESAPGLDPTTLRPRLQALMASYREDQQRWSQTIGTARTDAGRNAVPKVDDDAWARRAWALVRAAPGDPTALEACCQIATHFAFSEEAACALGRLRDSFFHEARLGDYCPLLATTPAPQAEAFLRAARVEHADATTRTRAGLALARYLRWQVLADHARKRKDGDTLLNIYLDPNEEARLVEEVEGICRAVMDGHADEPWVDYDGEAPTPTTMGKEAAGVLASIEEVDVRHLAVGRVAPEVVASDSDGVRLKLSGHRGKVVLLSFGGQHCVPCRKMIPHERDLRARLAGRPFAMIGFDRNEDKGAEGLKGFLAREKVTWRVCPGRSQDGRDVFRTWNVHAIPVFYLVDDLGVIRQRFDGYTEPELLRSAAEALVREAEMRDGPP